MASFVFATVLNHDRLEDAIVAPDRPAARQPASSAPSRSGARFEDALADDPSLGEIMRVDIAAVYDRDPACDRLDRAAALLQGLPRHPDASPGPLAVEQRPRTSPSTCRAARPEVFQTDIHPAVPIGPRHLPRPCDRPGRRADRGHRGRRVDPAGRHARRHRQGVRRPPSEGPARRADRRRRQDPRQYRGRRMLQGRRRLGGAASRCRRNTTVAGVPAQSSARPAAASRRAPWTRPSPTTGEPAEPPSAERAKEQTSWIARKSRSSRSSFERRSTCRRCRSKQRPQKKDSAEVYIGDEFIGVVFRDDEDGDLSYNFTMAILDIDLE